MLENDLPLQTIFEVALTVFRYLVDDLRVSYSSVIVFGRSLGSGPAIFLAAQYPWRSCAISHLCV